MHVWARRGALAIQVALKGCVVACGATHSRGMHDFQRLVVWQRARDLVVATERVARSFPRVDRGVISSQLRRSAVSIPANIAEGCGKSSRKETLRFLQIAAGSAKETQNHVLIACELGYISDDVREDLLERLDAVQRMLNRLMKNFPG